MTLSKHNSALTLEGLQTKPEGQYLERKGRDTKPTKIADELIGMLNADGGTLVYGISDNSTIEDLNMLTSRKLDAYRKLVHEFIHPPANIELEEIYLPGGQLIFLFHVEPDYERLFARKDNEAVYLRVADSNKGPLKREEVKKLEYNKAIRSYEEKPREDFDPIDLDDAVCEEYRKAMNYADSFEHASEFPKEAWLEGIVNAVCHRSYNLQGNCIYIKHFDDRLEMSNSGPLPAQVTGDKQQEMIHLLLRDKEATIRQMVEYLGITRDLLVLCIMKIFVFS